MKNLLRCSGDSFKRNWILIYNASLVLFLSLTVTNGYYNITETKLYVFYILTAILVLGILIYSFAKMFFNKKLFLLKPRFQIIDCSFCFFVLVSFISAFISEYQSDVWFGGNSRYQGFLTILLYAIVYFLVSRNYKDSEFFLIVMLLSFCIVALIATLNGFGVDVLGFYRDLSNADKSRFISTIGNINFYSCYMCLTFPFVIFGFSSTKICTSRVIYAVALVIGSFGMMATASESFVVGFAAGIAVIPLFIFDDTKKLKNFLVAVVVLVLASQTYKALYMILKEKNRVFIKISKLLGIFVDTKVAVSVLLICIVLYVMICKKHNSIFIIKKLYISVLIAICLFVILGFVISNTFLFEDDLGIFEDYFKLKPSWGTYRGAIWKKCVDTYKDFSLKEKLFGVGPEALHNVMHDFQLFNLTVDQAHNEYLNCLMTTGIVGLFSYVSMIFVTSYIFLRRLRGNTLATSLFVSLVAYWTQSFVNISQPCTAPIMYLYISIISGIYFKMRKIHL